MDIRNQLLDMLVDTIDYEVKPGSPTMIPLDSLIAVLGGIIQGGLDINASGEFFRGLNMVSEVLLAIDDRVKSEQ